MSFGLMRGKEENAEKKKGCMAFDVLAGGYQQKNVGRVVKGSLESKQRGPDNHRSLLAVFSGGGGLMTRAGPKRKKKL